MKRSREAGSEEDTGQWSGWGGVGVGGGGRTKRGAR
jgi:hypothetical protein